MSITDLFTRVNRITVDEAKDIIEGKGRDDLTVLDVREPAEYEQGHVPGAEFIPLSALQDRIQELDRSGTVITYCKRGPRSRSAAALLKRNGFEDVSYMDGGMDGWKGLKATGPFEAGLVLLEGRESLEDLLALAWSLEQGTGVFYARARESFGSNEEARQVFTDLINAEESHKAKLLDAYRHITGTEAGRSALEERALKGFMEGGMSVDEAVAVIKREKTNFYDILELCMQVETNSLDLYLKMRDLVQGEGAQNIFNRLIEEEKGHLARLGKLINQQAGS